MPSTIDPTTMPRFSEVRDDDAGTVEHMPSLRGSAPLIEETADMVTTTIRFEAYTGSETGDQITPPSEGRTEAIPSSIHDEFERLVANHTRTDLLTQEPWTDWRQLRDYVCSGIEARVGAFPRNPIKEKAIFESFFVRWGDRAERIARYAVDVHGCWWASAPISINRFCKGSDPYFAEVIAAQF